MLLGFLQIGTSEMLFIVFTALLLFGGKKLPELARGLGRGIREFKDASESIKREISDQINNFEKDLDVESAIIDDAEIDRQRQLAKAKAGESTAAVSDDTTPSDEADAEGPVREAQSQSPATTQKEDGHSETASTTQEPTYKDPRLQAIFTPPAGTLEHQSGREPNYESNLGKDTNPKT